MAASFRFVIGISGKKVENPHHASPKAGAVYDLLEEGMIDRVR